MIRRCRLSISIIFRQWGGRSQKPSQTNTANQANSISLGDTVYGTLSPSGDVDYFQFYATAGDTVDIQAAMFDNNMPYSELRLTDENGNFLGDNNYFGPSGFQQRIIVVMNSTGIRYIRYAPQDHTSGSLMMLEQPAKNNISALDFHSPLRDQCRRSDLNGFPSRSVQRLLLNHSNRFRTQDTPGKRRQLHHNAAKVQKCAASD